MNASGFDRDGGAGREPGLVGGIKNRPVRALLMGLVVLAIAYFAWRGVWRAASDSVDLTYGYTSAQAWIRGLNPYDPQVLTRLLRAGGGSEIANGVVDPLRNVYFPMTLPTFLPISFMSWPAARVLGLAINVGAAAFISLGLVRLLGWHPTSTRALGLIAYVLALGPLHLTIALGQTGVVATAGIVAGMLLERAGHHRSAGIMYGLATAVKVQIGLPFLAYLLWRRRWKTAGSAGVVVLGLSSVSALRMHMAGVPWLSMWLDNVAWLNGPAGSGNPSQTSLINLQYPLQAVIASGLVVSLITVIAVGAAAAMMVWFIRGRYPRHELLALSIVAVLTLLVTYHRYYDAVLLVLPIAWAISALETARWRQGVLVLVLCIDFIVPILGALLEGQGLQVLPSWLTESLLWQVILLPLHTWVLVSLVVVLLWAAARIEQDDDDPALVVSLHPASAVPT